MLHDLHKADWTKREGLTALTAALGADNIRWVGGAVRDGLLGVAVADVDCATLLLPAEVIARCGRAGIRIRSMRRDGREGWGPRGVATPCERPLRSLRLAPPQKNLGEVELRFVPGIGIRAARGGPLPPGPRFAGEGENCWRLGRGGMDAAATAGRGPDGDRQEASDPW